MMKTTAALAAALILAGCAATAQPTAPAPAPAPAPVAAAASAPAANPQPSQACLAMLDELSRAVPRDETGPVLRSKGLRIRTPIVLPASVTLDPKVVSAARVRVMINNRGRVVPGSVTVQQAAGDPALAAAIPAAAEEALSFDLSGAFSVPKEFPFTTVYVNCDRP